MKTKSLLVFSVLSFLLTACASSIDPQRSDNSSEESSQLHPTIHETQTYDVLKTSGVVYAEGLSHSDWGSDDAEAIPLLVDVYEPEGAPGNRPVILLIHGGGYQQGSRLYPPVVQFCGYFASRGWVAFSIDYRLQEDHGTVPQEWEDAIDQNYPEDIKDQVMAVYPANRDAKAALRWIYANASEYQVNTDYITVLGGSAGASMAIILGVTEEENFRDELSSSDDPTLISTHLDQPAEIHTIIDLWGSSGNIDRLDLTYGIESFDAADAPIMIAHGTVDDVVNFSNAEYIRDKYEETGVDYKFYALEGESHSAWSAKVDGMDLTQLSFDFIVSQQELSVLE